MHLQGYQPCICRDINCASCDCSLFPMPQFPQHTPPDYLGAGMIRVPHETQIVSTCLSHHCTTSFSTLQALPLPHGRHQHSDSCFHSLHAQPPHFPLLNPMQRTLPLALTSPVFSPLGSIDYFCFKTFNIHLLSPHYSGIRYQTTHSTILFINILHSELHILECSQHCPKLKAHDY